MLKYYGDIEWGNPSAYTGQVFFTATDPITLHLLRARTILPSGKKT